MTEDCLQGWDVARGLKEPAGEGVAQVVAPERHSGSAGDQDKAVGKGGMPLAVMVPRTHRAR